MNALVGYTGFVGSNLLTQYGFDALYNSKNIDGAYGTRPDMLVYSGMRAEKYLAGLFPDEDAKAAERAADDIRLIAPKRVVLISTVDVLGDGFPAYEDARTDESGLHPYGKNRLALENSVRRDFPDALIVRLPGLYGAGLKKNFIFDMLSVSPSMLARDKYAELAGKHPIIRDSYAERTNGFYALVKNSEALKAAFKSAGFTALCFTDSRASFQFYPLNRLWGDIYSALNAGIRLLHIATEPATASEVCLAALGMEFVNILDKPVPSYDMRTLHASVLNAGAKGGYIMSKSEVLDGVCAFARESEGERCF